MVIVKDQSSHLVYLNICIFELNWSSKLRENNWRRKNTLVTRSVLSQLLKFVTSAKVLISIHEHFSENKLFFPKNYVTSEGAVLTMFNILYYQQLSIARCQESFMLTIFFSNYQQCPSSAFNINHHRNCDQMRTTYECCPHCSEECTVKNWYSWTVIESKTSCAR